jgi:hypothetical protein
MKTIRNMMTVVGLSMVLFALGVAGAKAQQGQGLVVTDAAGTFTLPMDAQWGKMALPAGDYSLYYGRVAGGGPSMLEVVGNAKGSPHGFILAQTHNPTSATKSSIVCVREGDTLIVRALEMASVGKTIFFSLPHGAQLTAHRQNKRTYELADGPMLIQRVPLTLNAR